MKMENLAAVPMRTQHALSIHLASGAAQGPTPQAAFDAALKDAGVTRCSRLRQSSLIPPYSTIVRAKHRTLPDDPDRQRYVVMSQMQQSRPGQHAHAGLGWVQRGDDGRGLFIDLHDDVRERLERDLHAAFGAIAHFRDAAYGPVQTAFASRLCNGLPVCALVVAACAYEPW